jgi:hypothetical protein
MRLTAFTTLATYALLIQPAMSGNFEDDPMYQLGDLACSRVLDDKGFETYADAVGGDPSAFCGCVGAEFVANEPLQSFRMDMASETESAEVFAEILMENMDACLASGTLDGDFIDGDLVDVEGFEENFSEGFQDGPNWAEMPDRAHCELAIEGHLEPIDFDRGYIKDWIRDSGVGAEDLCTCAAAMMEDTTDEYATEMEDTNDPDLYWSYMNRAIDQCQTAIWKRY